MVKKTQTRSKGEARQYRAKHRDEINACKRRSYYKHGGQSMSENRGCTAFLGAHVAERMLSHLFKDVVRMPYLNPGYDFKCANDYLIDVKASCVRVDNRFATPYYSWAFDIGRNIIADFFLCMAFDNREALNPLHIWLIPGKVLSHLICASIAETTLDKWSEYEKPISGAINCCNTMRGDINGKENITEVQRH